MLIYSEHLTYLNNVNTYLQLVTNKMFLTQTAKSSLKPESTKIILKCFLNHTVKQFLQQNNIYSSVSSLNSMSNSVWRILIMAIRFFLSGSA